ncbi:MAG: ABC transporter substrate-binding protein [Candidatus Humimicrobiaceae bacterium]
MKKLTIGLLIVLMLASMLFIGIGCKAQAAETTAAETTAAGETTAAETTIAAETTVSNQEPVTLRMIHYAGGGTDFWNNLNASFMKEFPNIKIEQEVVDPGTYHQKLGGYVTAGDGPDIALMEAGLATIKYKDVLIDLKGKFGDIINDVVGLDVYYNNFDSSKELLALPSASNGHMIYYNKTVFKEAGLDPENPPKTWAEMDKAIKAIKAAGKEGIALGGKEYGNYWLWSALMNETMTKDEQIGLFKGTTKWNEGSLANVINHFEDMYKKGWFIKDAALASVTPEAQDMFINGDAAFFVSLLGDAFNWKIWGDSMGYENFGVMKIPQIEQDNPLKGVGPGELTDSVPVWGSYAWGITKWSKNPDAAVTYLKYLLRSDVQERFVLEGGFFPNNLKSFDVSKVTAPQFATLVDWAKNSKNVPGVFYATPEEWDAYVRNAQLLLSDQEDAKQFADDMQKVHDEVAK